MLIVILIGKKKEDCFLFTIHLKSISTEMEKNNFDGTKMSLEPFGDLFFDCLYCAVHYDYHSVTYLSWYAIILLPIILVLGFLVTSKCHVHALK